MPSSLVSPLIARPLDLPADSPLLGSAGPPAEIRDGALQLPRIIAAVRQHTRFLVTSHARPDGDAVGSVLAMGSVLHALGKQVDMVLADPIPLVYRTLPGVRRVRQTREIDQSDYDVAIILECDGTERTGVRGIDGMPNVINVDHHLTGMAFGSLNWIDPSAAAVAAMVFEIALALGANITPAIATCLYTALMTDTGSFTYPGTSADTFTLAHAPDRPGGKGRQRRARCSVLGAGCADPPAWPGPVARPHSRRHRMDLDHPGRPAADAATDEDSEGTVNYLISIAGVEAAAFLRELPRATRTHRRSSAPLFVPSPTWMCRRSRPTAAAAGIATQPDARCKAPSMRQLRTFCASWERKSLASPGSPANTPWQCRHRHFESLRFDQLR